MKYIGYELLLICAFVIAASIIWFGIYYYLKRKEQRGCNLSDKEKEWKIVSKFAGILFLISPIIILLIIFISDFLEGLFEYIIAIFIGIIIFLPSLIKKGKI